MRPSERSENSPGPFKIMFVCLGNICRSPAAQGVMESLVFERELGLEIEVDSAGTASYHIGRLPDARMVSAALKRGHKLTSQAKVFKKAYASERQLVLAMDRENHAEIARISGGDMGRVRMLSDYLDETWPRDVPDPYYGGEAGFENVLDMLEAACPKILAEILLWMSKKV
jgi:protein-tyrosine phosphatase